MTPQETQAAIEKLQRDVQELQAARRAMPGNQLSQPLDPLTVAAIRSAVAATPSAPGATYPGRVDYMGTAISLPAGWTSARLSTGVYAITHTLGGAGVTVLLGTIAGHGTLGSVHWVDNVSSGYFEARFANTSGSVIDADFFLAVFTP